MFESGYWKKELLRAASRLKKFQYKMRWTEKRASLLEREIMISMFCIRVLIERHKLGGKMVSKKIQLEAFPLNKGRSVNRLNGHQVDQHYDLNNPLSVKQSLGFVCNQFIHSFTIFPEMNGKRFTSVWVCSDFERNRFLYRVPIVSIIKLLKEAAQSYPTSLSYTYNKKFGDYVVTVDEKLEEPRKWTAAQIRQFLSEVTE